MQWGEREGRVRGQGRVNDTSVDPDASVCRRTNPGLPNTGSKAFTYEVIHLQVHSPKSSYT